MTQVADVAGHKRLHFSAVLFSTFSSSCLPLEFYGLKVVRNMYWQKAMTTNCDNAFAKCSNGKRVLKIGP